jgi:two-component system cell cycle sensor histidine kinase/response regulator CckA
MNAATECAGTLLIADDNAAVLSMLTVMLERLDYRVLAAKNGVEAVDLFHRNQDAIDLMVLDVVMPKLSGADAALRIREKRPELPLLFISGYADHALQQKIKVLDDYHMIPKPLSIAFLGHTIRTLLGKQ